MLRAAPTMRAVLHCLVNYMPVTHSLEALLGRVEQAGMAELRWSVRANVGLKDQANDQPMLLILKLLRTVSSSRFHPAWVQMSVDARPLTEVAERLAMPNKPALAAHSSDGPA